MEMSLKIFSAENQQHLPGSSNKNGSSPLAKNVLQNKYNFKKDSFVSNVSFGQSSKKADNQFQNILKTLIDEFYSAKGGKSRDKILLFLYENFSEKLLAQKIHPEIIYDVLNDGIVHAAEILEDAQTKKFTMSKEELLNTLNEHYSTLKPKRHNHVLDLYNNVRLDAPANSHEMITPIHLITDDYLKTISPQSGGHLREKFFNLINTIELPPPLKFILEARADGKTYAQISNELQLAASSVRNKCWSGIYKLQDSQNTLSEDFKTAVLNFKKEFYPDLGEDKIKEILIANPTLAQGNFNRYKENIYGLIELFNSKNLNITASQYTKAAQKSPMLFARRPETIFFNIIKASEKIGIPAEIYLQAALKQPSLFTIKPEKIFKSISETAKMFNISNEQYINAALRQPSLFGRTPETIFNNVKKVCDKLNIPMEKYVNAALKKPTIFAFSPVTIISNVRKSSKKFNISEKEYTLAGLQNPQLFYQSPAVLYKNVSSAAKKLHVPLAQYVQSILRAPALFHFSSDTIVNNIKTASKLLNISIEEYTKAALTHPQLFYKSPASILKNIEAAAKILNISNDEYIKAGMKFPHLYSTKADTVIKKANCHSLLMEIKLKLQNQNKTREEVIAHIINHKSLTNSTDYLYSLLFRFLIAHDNNVPQLTRVNLINRVNDYFAAHRDKDYAEKLVQKYIFDRGLKDHPAVEGLLEFLPKLKNVRI